MLIKGFWHDRSRVIFVIPGRQLVCRPGWPGRRGISGLAIVVKAVTESWFGFAVPLAVTNLVLNVPLYIISLKQRGFGFIQKSIYAVLLMTLFLWVVEYIPNIFDFKDDLLLAALACGVLSGVGIGMVMRVNGTTGGTEMLAAIVKYIHPHFPIAKLIFLLMRQSSPLAFSFLGRSGRFTRSSAFMYAQKLLTACWRASISPRRL